MTIKRQYISANMLMALLPLPHTAKHLPRPRYQIPKSLPATSQASPQASPKIIAAIADVAFIAMASCAVSGARA